MQQKIQRAKIWQLKPLDFAMRNAFEVLLHTFSRNLANEDRIQLIMKRNQSDVRCIAFVPRTRMGQFYQLYFHVSSTSTTGVISSLGISAGQ